MRGAQRRFVLFEARPPQAQGISVANPLPRQFNNVLRNSGHFCLEQVG